MRGLPRIGKQLNSREWCESGGFPSGFRICVRHGNRKKENRREEIHPPEEGPSRQGEGHKISSKIRQAGAEEIRAEAQQRVQLCLVPQQGQHEGQPDPGREHKLAEDALKLVDQAASVLRDGIRTGAATTAKSRIAAKKKANDLLGKASSNLSKAIGDSASMLQNLLGKI
jgi:hypothetical protein